MMSFKYVVVLTVAVTAKMGLGFVASGSRSGRHITCRENEQYPHGSYCCLNCPAGTYVEQPCKENLMTGVCAPCPDDTYTELANGLEQCLPCTRCRSDEDVLSSCNSTKNKVCRCKTGFYCPRDQACEVCKKCTKCEKDEQVLENCGFTSNTVCEKKASSLLPVAAPVTVVVLIVLLLMIYFCWKKRDLFMSHSSIPNEFKINMDGQSNGIRGEVQSTDHLTRNGTPSYQEPLLVGAQLSPGRDGDRGDDRLPDATSSPRSCLSPQASLPCYSSSANTYCESQRQPGPAGDSQYRRLVPSNGHESLKASFYHFENVDIRYHRRFFRCIGLHDNAIQSASHLTHADKVYELLRQWMEIKGVEADINDLIGELVNLDQRLTADIITRRLITSGEYSYEEI